MDSRCFSNADLWKVWCWCLMKANHEGKWVPIVTGKGESEVWVDKGQFIFGRNSAAKKLKMKPTSLYDRMKKLQNMQNLVMQSRSHYTLITVINWDRYQKENEEAKTENRQATVRQPSGNRQATVTNKNDKNVKNDNKIIYPDEFLSFWKKFPAPARNRSSLKQAYTAFKKAKTIITIDFLNRQSDAWIQHWNRNSNAKYAPAVHRWLNNKKWEFLPEETGEQDGLEQFCQRLKEAERLAQNQNDE